MADTQDEIVKLVIDAENLSTDELREAANNVDVLADKATQAKKELNQLRVTQGQIESFEQLSVEFKQLQNELAESNAELKESKALLKQDGIDREKHSRKIEKQSLELTNLKRRYKSVETEYLKSQKALKDLGVSTRNLTKEKLKLVFQLNKAETASKKTRQEFDKQAAALKRQVAVEKEATRAAEKKAEADKKVGDRLRENIKKFDESADRKGKDSKATRESAIQTKKYEVALKKLNDELKRGIITKGQYIKREDQLRRSHKLSAAQASVTRRSVEADIATSNKRSRSTDVLTGATRRLAQAYTLLIAAQKASQAVGASVKGYGDLESAMTKVQKTTDLARDSLLNVTGQLQELANDVTPTATNELLRYGEVAGQLGENTPEAILNIAAAADALNLSTNLAGEEAVTLLTRMLKMSGEGTPAIHNLASAMVDLGNNTAATEAEIAHMTKEVLTGTSSLDLGSSAAAGFAATLIEAGQQAERSRGALFKLSDAINQAAANGGEDLERLANHIGLTGEEIRKQLGEDSSVVLIKFVEGLKRVKDEGGLVSQTLKSFGIDGILANAVLGNLADSSDRLAENVNRSNSAFEDGNKHLEEAAKAYANQESQIGRLINRFEKLKVEAGSAFADEVFTSVNKFDDLLKQHEGTVIEMANAFGDLTEFVVETIEILEDLAAEFGVLEGGAALLNALKIAMNFVQLGFQGLQLAALHFKKEFLNLLDVFGDYSEELAEVTKRQDELMKKMQGNVDDLGDAWDDFHNESSATFRDLQDAVEKYGGAVDRLTERQKAQLEEALKDGNYKPEHTKLYSDLTAEIIRQQRELEILAETQEIAAEAGRKYREEQEAQKKSNEEASAAIDKYGKDIDNYILALETLTTAYRNGTISQDEYIAKTDVLNNAVKRLEEQAKATKDAQNVSNEVFGKSSETIAKLTSDIRSYTNEVADLKRQQGELTEGTLEYAEVTAKLQLAKENLSRSQRSLQIQQELENKTLSELIVIQREHQVELAKIEQQRKSGTLTLAEYEKAIADAKFKTDLLKKAIGEEKSEVQANTEALNENTEALNENTDSLDGRQKSVAKGIQGAKESTGAISLWLEMEQRLNRELDYSAETNEDLAKELKKLAGQYRIVRTTASGWWDDIIEMSNAYTRKQQATIEATLELRKYTERVQESSLSLQELAKYAGRADKLSSILGENQLRPLRDAIKDAQREFYELDQTINNSFDDVQDRLDAILGNERAIVKRQFEREMNELLDLLDQAKQSGDAALVRKIEEAIRNLERAQKLEFEDQFGDDSSSFSSNKRSSSGSSQQNGFGSTNSGSVQPVVINVNGQPVSLNVASQGDADNLIDVLMRIGAINQAGVQ